MEQGMEMNRLIARKSDIRHKVEMGILFDAYYDTETTDLDKRFAEITQFGGAITDLAGNILHHVNLRAKVSSYTVISPFAWLVQRMRLEDLDHGDPRSIFMGKIKRFFENASQLYRAPFSERFLESCQKGVFKNPDGKEEGYYSYPVTEDDGAIDWDYIRIHENLKKFYFKDESGKWQKRDIKSLSIGYNNINADDQWLWTQAFMSGFENIFITHLPRNGQYRLDALRVVEALYGLGGAGENGLKVPLKATGVAEKGIPSLSLGKVLAENTRTRSDMRGITDGVELEDGSQVVLNQLHGALQDALALRGLMVFMRKHHAEHLAQMERNTDWKYVIDRMTETDDGFGINPPMAYIDKTYPVIDGKMISLIGTDQYRNAPKTAVVWNLDVDPKTYRYNGQGIADLGENEWKKIFEEGRSNPNSPLKILKAHKSVRLFPAEDGYTAGFNKDMDRQEIYARITALKKSRCHEKIMKALRLAYPRITGVDHIVLPQPEEELFTFSTLELFDAEAREDVQVHSRVHNRIEMVAQKSRAHVMKIKALWLRAVQFDELAFLDETRGRSAQSIQEKVKSINKELEKLGSPKIPEPDSSLDTDQAVLAYKIKILFFARNYFAQGLVQDIGHHFWFEDKDGIRYSDKEVRAWPQDKIDLEFGTGSVKIVHERVHTTVPVIDRMIEELGYAHILGQEVNAQLNANKALRINGIPHYQGKSTRWYTVAEAKKDIAKIELNELQDSELAALDNVLPGLWSERMEEHHDSVAALEEYKLYIRRLERLNIEQDMYPYLGLDKQTGYPLKRSEFEISRDSHTIVDVPDRYLEKPYIDPASGRAIWILPLKEEFGQAAEISKDVLLRAKETGKIYHLATARRIDLPPKGGVYRELYNHVANVYAETGLEPSEQQGAMALVGNGPYPVHGLRPVTSSAQTLHMDKSHFEGLMSYRLAGYGHPVTGMILRDDNLKLIQGKVRIQEVRQEEITGWEIETDITEIRPVSIDDIFNFSSEDLSRYGYRTRDEALDHFCSLFARQKKDPRQSKNKAWAIAFGNIAPDDPVRGMMYFKPDERIYSRLTPN